MPLRNALMRVPSGGGGKAEIVFHGAYSSPPTLLPDQVGVYITTTSGSPPGGGNGFKERAAYFVWGSVWVYTGTSNLSGPGGLGQTRTCIFSGVDTSSPMGAVAASYTSSGSSRNSGTCTCEIDDGTSALVFIGSLPGNNNVSLSPSSPSMYGSTRNSGGAQRGSYSLNRVSGSCSASGGGSITNGCAAITLELKAATL